MIADDSASGAREQDRAVRTLERRLAAILIADVAQYSSLTERDEERTHRRLMGLRHLVIDPTIGAHGGTLVKNTGDGFLAVFDSILEAARCAIDLQNAALQFEAAEPTEERLLFRIGLNIGDIIIEKSDVFGDGINIAARLQQKAEPGGIVISASAREQLGGNLNAPYLDFGELKLKNLRRRVRAFQILSDSHEGTAPDHAAPLKKRASIAVLPFRTPAAQSKRRYVGEGIVEDLVACFTAFPELFVISRNSTVGYRGETVDIRQIGRELGVRYVLSGSVRQTPRGPRLLAELSDTERLIVVWSGQYGENAGSILDIQDKVVAQIVHVIAPEVRHLELNRIRRKRPQNMDAYDLVLQALELRYSPDRKALESERRLLRRAIRLDPHYAVPHALLAEWYSFRVGQISSEEVKADSNAAIKFAVGAISRDPRNVLALSIYGHQRSFLLRDFAGALSFFDRALTVAPSSAFAWGQSSPTLSYLGKATAAIERAEHARRLSPLDPLGFWTHSALALAHMTNGSFDEALHWSRLAFQEKPNYLANVRFLVACAAATGAGEEARSAADHLLTFDPGFRVEQFISSYPYSESERRERFALLLRKGGLPG